MDSGIVRQELTRILASRQFAASERLSQLLRFLVEEVLDGRAASLKESTIGVSVFDRPPGYESDQDPVVRVTVTRLRAKLAEFYANNPPAALRIELPKPGYVPKFEPVASPPVTPSPSSHSPKRWAFVALLAVALLTAFAWRFALPYTPFGPSKKSDTQAAFEKAMALRRGPTRGMATMREFGAELERLLRLDPNFVLAHVELARHYLALRRHNEVSPQEGLELANRHLTRALSLDGNLVEALIMVCQVKAEAEWDWTGAEAACQRAITLSPRNASAHACYAKLLSYSGRLEESIKHGYQAIALKPDSVINHEHFIRHLYLARRFDEAQKFAHHVLSMDSVNTEARVVLALVASAQGRHPEAIIHFERMIESMGKGVLPSALAGLGYEYGVVGQHAKAKKILQEFEALGKSKPISHTICARLYLGLGDQNRALDLLQRSVADRDYWLLFLIPDPRLDSIRSHPKFKKILSELHIPNNLVLPSVNLSQ